MDNRRREDGMHESKTQQRFCGREFSIGEVSLIQEVVNTCGGISRNELANTVCDRSFRDNPPRRIDPP